MQYAVWSAVVGFSLFALAIVGPRKLSAPALLLAFLPFTMNMVLPLTVRCRVCGLQLETCLAARDLSRDRRLKWIEALDQCPVCHDDGTASEGAKAAWRTSGMQPEEPYWSVARLIVAVAAACALIGVAVAFASRYQVR